MFSVGSDDSDVCEVTEVRPPALTRARSNSFSFGSDDSVCVVKEVIRRPQASTSSNSKPASTVAVGDPTVPQHRRVSFAVFYPPELRIRPTLQYFDSLSSVQSLLENAVEREECDALKPASCKLISGSPRKLNLFNERGDLVLDSMLLDAHAEYLTPILGRYDREREYYRYEYYQGQHGRAERGGGGSNDDHGVAAEPAGIATGECARTERGRGGSYAPRKAAAANKQGEGAGKRAAAVHGTARSERRVDAV